MSPLRVISGSARGTHLKDVPGNTTRPITDRVKEALFNILADDVIGSTWLDLFAGTGAVGIEALSRGADLVQFLDINRQAVNVIKVNLSATHLDKRAAVTCMDSFRYLRETPISIYEYIYVAPPQYKNMWLEALDAIDMNPGWLSEDGWVIAQIDPTEYTAHPMAHLTEFEQRRYGSTLLVFYERVIPGQT